jgi:hypothetical protein
MLDRKRLLNHAKMAGLAGLILLLLQTTHPANAGYVTPQNLTLQISQGSIRSLDQNGNSTDITANFSPAATFTFNDTDTAFAISNSSAVSLQIPSGLYTKITVQFSGGTAVLAGHQFQGDVSDSRNGKYICSSDSSHWTYSSSACVNPATLTLPAGALSNAMTTDSSGNWVAVQESYFPVPVCIFDSTVDGASYCSSNPLASSDYSYDVSQGTLSFLLLVDLYNYFGVGGLSSDTTGTIQPQGGGYNLFPTNGAPIIALSYTPNDNSITPSQYASIHISHQTSGSEDAEYTILIDSLGSLIFAQANTYGALAAGTGICPGLPWINVVDNHSIVSTKFIGKYDSANHKLAFHGTPGGNWTLRGSGMNLVSGLNGTVGTPVGINCVPDSNSSNLISSFDSLFSAFLGFAYDTAEYVYSNGSPTDSPGDPTGSPQTAVIKKVSDPGNILGNGSAGSYP